MTTMDRPSTRRRTIVGLGEIVWDLFADGRRLGGAPANVAYHAAMLGDRGVVVSRVGDDEPGRAAVELLQQRGLDTSAIQIDRQRPTGRVSVQLNPEPCFTIDDQAAWTAPQWSASLERLLAGADLVCFGSLLQSFAAGRELLRRARRAAGHAIWLLDLNLRPPLTTAHAVDAALVAAHVLKLSEDEHQQLSRHLGVSNAAAWLLQEWGLRAVAITRGARGSKLITPAGALEYPGCAAASGGDAVGAGDAFTAALAYHMVRAHPLQAAQAAANRYAAFVASRHGAMPEIPAGVRADAQSLSGQRGSNSATQGCP